MVSANPETTSPTADQRKLARPDVTPRAQPITASASPIRPMGVARIGRKNKSVLITPSTTDATPNPSGCVLTSDGRFMVGPCGTQARLVAGHLRERAPRQVVGVRQGKHDQDPRNRRHDHA